MTQNSEYTKPKVGGKRAGAGRPKGSTTVAPEMRRVPVQIRLPQWMAEWLKELPVPAGRLIETALVHWGSEIRRIGPK